MNIVIIEDEELAAERLERMLQQIDPEINVMAKIGSVKESVKWLKEHNPDLLFVDIQLSDGISFSIFEQIDSMVPLIFTTAYDQYAIEAFKLNSVSYLLKPIGRKELAESLRKFNQLRSAYGIDFNELKAMYEGEKVTYKRRFLISVGEKLKKVEVEQIAYFYAMEKSVFFKTMGNKTLSVDHTLDQLEEMLDPDRFFRINRKYIVNMDSIDEMVMWSRNRIKLNLLPNVSDQDDTIVSVNRSSDFRKWMNQ